MKMNLQHFSEEPENNNTTNEPTTNEPANEPKGQAYKNERLKGKAQGQREFLDLLGVEDISQFKEQLTQVGEQIKQSKEEIEELKQYKARAIELEKTNTLIKSGIQEEHIPDVLTILNNTPEEEQQAKLESLLPIFSKSGSNVATNASTPTKPNNNNKGDNPSWLDGF